VNEAGGDGTTGARRRGFPLPAPLGCNSNLLVAAELQNACPRLTRDVKNKKHAKRKIEIGKERRRPDRNGFRSDSLRIFSAVTLWPWWRARRLDLHPSRPCSFAEPYQSSCQHQSGDLLFQEAAATAAIEASNPEARSTGSQQPTSHHTRNSHLPILLHHHPLFL